MGNVLLPRAPRPREVVRRERVDPSYRPRRADDAGLRGHRTLSANASCPLGDVVCQADEAIEARGRPRRRHDRPVETPVDDTVDPVIDEVRDLVEELPR